MRRVQNAARRRAERERQAAEQERRRLAAAHQVNIDHARRQREAAAAIVRDPLRSGGFAPTDGSGHNWPVPQVFEGSVVEWAELQPFAIGKYEVTVGQFKLFVDRADYRTEARRDDAVGGVRDRTDLGGNRIPRNWPRRPDIVPGKNPCLVGRRYRVHDRRGRPLRGPPSSDGVDASPPTASQCAKVEQSERTT